MTKIHWRGDATAVAQVTTATPANVEVGDQFTLTINNKSVTYVATAATVGDVTAGLAAAWNASPATELAEVTATDDLTHLTLIADVPGTPFTVSAAAIDGGGTDTQTLVLATPVASAGPRHWDTAANWVGAVLPASADDVYLEHSAASIRYGLDQAAVTLTSLHIAASFTGEIGLPRINSSGAVPYVEYRDRALKIGATDVVIGHGPGEGSGRMQLDTGTVRATIVVRKTGTPAEADLPPLLWKGTHVSNALHVTGGHLGVAIAGGEVANLNSFSQAGGEVEIGSAAILSTLSVSGSGRLIVGSTFSALKLAGGEVRVIGSASAVTIDATGGVLDFRSVGTITNLNVAGAAALIDFSHDGRTRNVANCTLTRGEILDPLRTVIYGTGIVPGGQMIAHDAA